MDESTLSFLAGLAHDLRTPLAAIGGHAELLRLGVHGPVLPKQTESLERIRQNYMLMAALIVDVLEYAEAATGTIHLTKGPLALEPAVRNAIGAVSERAMENQQTIRVAPAGAPGTLSATDDAADAAATTVTADPRVLETLLIDVLNDALESGAGGEIVIAISCSGHTALVEVQGSGKPIEESSCEALFIPFDRLASGNRTPGLSHALALPRARVLARALGGDTMAISGGSGRTIRVQLPLANQEFDRSDRYLCA